MNRDHADQTKAIAEKSLGVKVATSRLYSYVVNQFFIFLMEPNFSFKHFHCSSSHDWVLFSSADWLCQDAASGSSRLQYWGLFTCSVCKKFHCIYLHFTFTFWTFWIMQFMWLVLVYKVDVFDILDTGWPWWKTSQASNSFSKICTGSEVSIDLAPGYHHL